MSSARMSLLTVAIAAGLLDVAALIAGSDRSWLGYMIFMAVHLLAAELIRHRVRSLCGGNAAGTLAILGAYAVPVFGTCLAATIRIHDGPGDDARTQGILDEYDEWVHFREQPHRPSAFTGDFQEDLVTFACVESHAVVLRSGTVAQKREVLSRLVDSERPELVSQVREALLDPDPEVRLLAYGELQRLETRLYRELEEACEVAETAAPGDNVRTTPVFAHRRLASSGVLDEAMSAWHAQEAARLEQDVGSMVSAGAPTGAVDPVHMAAAAFRERSFAYVRAFGRALAADGRPVPTWIRALDPDIREEVA